MSTLQLTNANQSKFHLPLNQDTAQLVSSVVGTSRITDPWRHPEMMPHAAYPALRDVAGLSN
ncbi:MAG: hypothetical protein ACK5Q5_05250 [Planctomycetaceae bacterium]